MPVIRTPPAALSMLCDLILIPSNPEFVEGFSVLLTFCFFFSQFKSVFSFCLNLILNPSLMPSPVRSHCLLNIVLRSCCLISDFLPRQFQKYIIQGWPLHPDRYYPFTNLANDDRNA